MSEQLIRHNADLKRLRDEGYDVEVRGPLLIVRDVPYVAPGPTVARGIFVKDLALAGDATTRPEHSVYFHGSHPCDKDGKSLDVVVDTSARDHGDGLQTQFRFSRDVEGGYADHYELMTTYIGIVSGPAEALDSTATPMTFPVVEESEDESVFVYRDTATSRSGLMEISKRLVVDKVAIVGLGGTGSYILDFLSKTPIREIHLFDGDMFISHNAFRAPGAAPIETLREKLTKADYLTAVYSRIRRSIFPHGYLDEANVEALREMSFVFLAIDKGEPKRLALAKLQEFGVAFIDVGMGVDTLEDSGMVTGILRVSTSTPAYRDATQRMDVSDGDINDAYSRNIQVSELNALNAALAVIRWKRCVGFYDDAVHEHHTIYHIDANLLSNEFTA